MGADEEEPLVEVEGAEGGVREVEAGAVGALDAGAQRVSTPMKLAAAWAIAGMSIERDELIPDVLDPAVHEHVAEAVRKAAEDA